MADFSVILQSPEIRQIVQENILERAFHDALFPRLLFRGEAVASEFPGNVGDTMTFTGAGLIRPKPRPLAPGTDPTPSTYAYEQWSATIQQYADSIDSHMPTAIMAIANLFLRDAHQIGLSAGQTLNRLVRNRLYNAALSGHTLADGAQVLNGTSGTLRVLRLNGFTLARRPDLAQGSAVRFSEVSSTNPLQILVTHGAGTLSANVVGYTPDVAGDLVGPGTLALTYTNGAYNVADRGNVRSLDRTNKIIADGSATIDGLGTGDVLTLALIRSAVARFRTQNVPEHADGSFHCHLDPMSEAQIFGDAEFQRLLTSLPDYYMYNQFAIGKLLGTVFYRNTESPLAETVGDATGAYDTDDNFAGELENATGVSIHRPLFTAQGCIYEYYVELGQLISEAGVTGKVAEPQINHNGIEINTERIQLIIRAPLNRLQDLVSTTYKFIGDWPIRTDVVSGDAARYKRMLCIETG